MIGVELSDIDQLSKLPPHHRDPFDRMLVAQSLRGDFTLVTEDSVMSAYGARTLWFNEPSGLRTPNFAVPI